ncbi:PREDICTED: matrix-remodeling-associated protein 7 isoform X1 [Chinchilla lanigera]|uniref:matrix-remodeling-associated protein 7 isoform X1 n=1 Tax=Chinchilla lanigera TaxID=34839 RepID=UPI0006960602|nr:PREDICTED: matrix-remodeling-associated protein 7 isoform X1 [Chinchilla lanigera]
MVSQLLGGSGRRRGYSLGQDQFTQGLSRPAAHMDEGWSLCVLYLQQQGRGPRSLLGHLRRARHGFRLAPPTPPSPAAHRSASGLPAARAPSMQRPSSGPKRTLLDGRTLPGPAPSAPPWQSGSGPLSPAEQGVCHLSSSWIGRQEEEQDSDADKGPAPAEPEDEEGEAFSFKYSPGQLRGNQYKKMMTKEELEEEQRVQKEQLAAIFKLMKDNKETFGELSDGDVQEQLRLYDM